MGYKVSEIEYYKKYLLYATMFEKNVYIWSNAMTQANNHKKNIYERKKHLQNNLNHTQSKLSSYNVADNIKHFEKEASEYQKISRIALIVLVVVTLFCVATTVLVACGESGVSPAEFTSFFFKDIYSFMYLLVFVFLGIFVGAFGSIIGPICIYIYRKNKNKAKQSQKEAKAQTKFNHSMVLEVEKERYQNQIQQNSVEEKYITQRQGEISNALIKAKNNLNNLYAENILPAKYRSFNAVATMYEYLETGRCTTIKGHGGIFDTYEKDLQMGIVIRNLENINASLSRIESNQQMLFKELKQANSTLRTINSSLDDISKTNAQIAHNTAISAEANKQTAAAAQWFTWRAWARGF
ncbi:MAG: hypothetical protein IJZ59_01505 [Alphaproteobacteria bacterium]|nr:hypothetical protein [Alphaproteobacteria bacterium]